MINVSVTDSFGTELARVTIENISESSGEVGRYVSEVAVERGGAIGLHRTVFDFNRTQYNVLGLVSMALSTLTPEQLELEDAPILPSDLARRRRGVGR